MAPTLLELPLEVLLNITSFLDTPSYGKLRRVSSPLEKNTFEAFAKEFFSTKQFMITTFSLQTLLDISHHPTLKNFLRKVIIGIEALSGSGPNPDLEEGVRDQRILLALGGFQRYLTAALRNLPNCHEIELRDFESRTKQRDDGVWRGYGMKTWRQRGGIVNYHWGRDYNFSLGITTPSAIFNNVLNSIADSGIRCSYLGHVTKHDPNALQDTAFALDILQLDGVSRALTTLTSLTLALKSPGLGYSGFLVSSELRHLSALLEATTSLTRLRLNGDLIIASQTTRTSTFHITSLVEVLARAPLTQLELGKLSIDASSFNLLLDAIVKGSGKLERLTLFRILLKDDDQWVNIIDKLTTVPTLKYVCLTALAQSENMSRGQRTNGVAFRKHVSASDAPGMITNHAIFKTPSGTSFHGLDHGRGHSMAEAKKLLVIMDRAWMKKHHGEEDDTSSEDNFDDSYDEHDDDDIIGDEIEEMILAMEESDEDEDL